MATKVLSNEFMQNIATEEAWKELSMDHFNDSEVPEEDQLGDVLSNCRRHHPHRVQYRDIQREMELARTLKQ